MLESAPINHALRESETERTLCFALGELALRMESEGVLIKPWSFFNFPLLVSAFVWISGGADVATWGIEG